jgi:hypothetical protein
MMMSVDLHLLSFHSGSPLRVSTPAKHATGINMLADAARTTAS